MHHSVGSQTSELISAASSEAERTYPLSYRVIVVCGCIGVTAETGDVIRSWVCGCDVSGTLRQVRCSSRGGG